MEERLAVHGPSGLRFDFLFGLVEGTGLRCVYKIIESWVCRFQELYFI